MNTICRLIENIRLCDTRAHLDSFTVATSVLEDREAFLNTLAVISQVGRVGGGSWYSGHIQVLIITV